MAGILDKKSRLFDYQLTTDGRKQIQRNDLRFVYASFSDSSIVYNEDESKLGLFKNKIDGSEDFFLPLESTTKENTTFVKEFKLNREEKSYNDVFTFNIEQDLMTSAKSKINEISISSKIINQQILTRKTGLSPETFTFKIQSTNESGEFNFKNTRNINLYPTILNSHTSVRNIQPIYNDKRFSEKINFMKMSPVNVNGEKVFEDSSFIGLEEFNNKSNVDFIFKAFDEKITFSNENDREKSISDIINVMNSSNNIIKKTYDLVEEDSSDTLFLEMFEVENKTSSEGRLEKLIFIKLGEIFNNVENAYKDVYLVGKIKYNNRELEEEKIDINDQIKKLEQVFNNELSYKFVNSLLSNYYSFVNMFVIVAE